MGSGLAAFRLTERDVSIIIEIALSDVLDSDQAVRLGLFSGISRARRRMALLAAHGYLRRMYVADGTPSARSVFAIGAASAGIFAERTGISAPEASRQSRREFGRMFLEHSRAVTEVRLAISGAGEARPEFIHEKMARHEYEAAVGKDLRPRIHTFKPDGAFRFVRGERPLVAFLEADRSSSSAKKVGGNLAGYAKYLRLGLFEEEYGLSECAVLFVTASGGRRVRNVCEIASQIGGMPVYAARLEDVVGPGRCGPGTGAVWAHGPKAGPLSLADIIGVRGESR